MTNIGVAALREQFAVEAAATAQHLREELGRTDQEAIIEDVRAAASETAQSIALAFVEAAEMGLALWQATR
jgi:hypothetical protein